MDASTNGHMPYRPKKIVIMGAGDIGEKVWEHLTANHMAENIVVWNRSNKHEENVFEGKLSARDQENILLENGHSTSGFKFTGSDKTRLVTGVENLGKALEGADIIINTAGEARVKGDTDRSKLAKANYENIIHNYAKTMGDAAPNALVINVTNPVDQLTQVLAEEGGMNPNRVLGLSGELDRTRLFQAIAVVKGMAHDQIDKDSVIAIGQHGKAMVAVISNAKDKQGNPIFNDPKSPEAQRVIEETVMGGDRLVENLGKSDGRAPAAAIYKMVEAFVGAKNGKSQKPIYASAYDAKEDVFIGRPIEFQKDGTYKTLPLPKLSPTEQIEWQKSIETCKKAIDGMPGREAPAAVAAR